MTVTEQPDQRVAPIGRQRPAHVVSTSAMARLWQSALGHPVSAA